MIEQYTKNKSMFNVRYIKLQKILELITTLESLVRFYFVSGVEINSWHYLADIDAIYTFILGNFLNTLIWNEIAMGCSFTLVLYNILTWLSSRCCRSSRLRRHPCWGCFCSALKWLITFYHQIQLLKAVRDYLECDVETNYMKRSIISW